MCATDSKRLLSTPNIPCTAFPLPDLRCLSICLSNRKDPDRVVVVLQKSSGSQCVHLASGCVQLCASSIPVASGYCKLPFQVLGEVL